MSNPIAALSVVGTEEPESGRHVETLGHTNYGLQCVVNGDPTGVEVVLEGSVDGEICAQMDNPTADRAVVDDTQFNEDPESGYETAHASAQWRGQYVRYIRARVLTAPAEGPVAVWLLACGNASGAGTRPTERKGPAHERLEPNL